MRISFHLLPITMLALACSNSLADELSLYLGSGPQAGSDQRNSIAGIDYSFYTLKRSSRQHLQIGVSYSQLKSNRGSGETLHAISIYPQLTFYPRPTSKIAQRMPMNARAFFFTRVLGPTFISRSELGERNQANHFAFQAELGVGVVFEKTDRPDKLLTLSWRHLSNANLYSPNDGMDVPLVIRFGMRY